MHDSASSTSGAQILSAVHHLKQLYESLLDLNPAAFDEKIIQLSLITSTPSLHFLLAQTNQLTLDAFSRPDARARFTDELSKFITPQRAARAPPAHPSSRNALVKMQALAAKPELGGAKNYKQIPRNKLYKGAARPQLSCEHCKKTGHTVADCWQLNGFPPKNEQPITVNSGQAAAKRAANYTRSRRASHTSTPAWSRSRLSSTRTCTLTARRSRTTCCAAALSRPTRTCRPRSTSACRPRSTST
mmetsp:Transcript_25603/g.63295  ORF Transcript_25603/g.63295 Transcript_25603/m.63295 type:complete len:245 (+) Transcript_25603:514-1248(+)